MSQQIFDFEMIKTIKPFDDSIYNHKIEIHKANQERADLIKYIFSFNDETKPRSDDNKSQKIMFLIVQKNSMRVENYFLMLLKADYFHLDKQREQCLKY